MGYAKLLLTDRIVPPLEEVCEILEVSDLTGALLVVSWTQAVFQMTLALCLRTEVVDLGVAARVEDLAHFDGECDVDGVFVCCKSSTPGRASCLGPILKAVVQGLEAQLYILELLLDSSLVCEQFLKCQKTLCLLHWLVLDCTLLWVWYFGSLWVEAVESMLDDDARRIAFIEKGEENSARRSLAQHQQGSSFPTSVYKV